MGGWGGGGGGGGGWGGGMGGGGDMRQQDSLIQTDAEQCKVTVLAILLLKLQEGLT